ncbi:hypothetical protein JKP88DRAFT_349547 [Tribonema minus]|uniref:Peptidase S49 domain-containing protein n=1 Tax=Tribonema minus TaxID=303371 RepID=A0A835YS56_9STRA|nr:hypothetical protein JKP88DRAFT_349547 [Tribonema minus]
MADVTGALSGKFSDDFCPQLIVQCMNRVADLHCRFHGDLRGWNDTEEEEEQPLSHADGDTEAGDDSDAVEGDAPGGEGEGGDADDDGDAEDRGWGERRRKHAQRKRATGAAQAANGLKVLVTVALVVLIVIEVFKRCDAKTLISLAGFLVYAFGLYQKAGGGGGVRMRMGFDVKAAEIGKRHFSFELMNYEFSKDKAALRVAEKQAAAAGAAPTPKQGEAPAAHNVEEMLKSVMAGNKDAAKTNEARKKASPSAKDTPRERVVMWVKQHVFGSGGGGGYDDGDAKHADGGGDYDGAAAAVADGEAQKPSEGLADKEEGQADKEDGQADKQEGQADTDASAAENKDAAAATADAKPQRKPHVYVLEFTPQQMLAGISAYLADAASFLIDAADPATDEVVILLTSPGGGVSEYGLATSHLERIRDAGIKLTVCVDTIAASGGYMMAVVASHLVAAPFAMVGSIGVRGGLLNFNKALRERGVESILLTAGKYKAPLTSFNEDAFKAHIKRHRPQIDVDAVGTGEVWLGVYAESHGLVDEVGTSAQYLRRRMTDGGAEVLRLVKYEQPRSMELGLLRKSLLGPFAMVSVMFARMGRLLQAAEIALGTSHAVTDGQSQVAQAVPGPQPMLQYDGSTPALQYQW